METSGVGSFCPISRQEGIRGLSGRWCKTRADDGHRCTVVWLLDLARRLYQWLCAPDILRAHKSYHERSSLQHYFLTVMLHVQSWQRHLLALQANRKVVIVPIGDV